MNGHIDIVNDYTTLVIIESIVYVGYNEKICPQNIASENVLSI